MERIEKTIKKYLIEKDQRFAVDELKNKVFKLEKRLDKMNIRVNKLENLLRNK